MRNFGKYLLLILAFSCTGGGSIYGNTLPDLREDHPFSSHDLQAASPILWAHRENPLQKLSDVSENLFFDSFSVIPISLSHSVEEPATTNHLGYNRDLRYFISQQIFPKHFFL